MSSDSSQHSRSLPARPNLRHLKDQAKELLEAGKAESLAKAQFRLAREYGFASWPKLKSHVESLEEVGHLKDAIDANDFARVREMMSRNPSLHRAPLGYNNNGPLTWAAECRGKSPTTERLMIVEWMIENGSDVHQGGDGPLMRAALRDDRIPMMELLLSHGANVNARWDGRYPIIFAPCETLQAGALRWLIARGADMSVVSDGTNCVQMLIGTYSRNPEGKHACLEAFVDAGFSLPHTAPMAVHRGRIDLLADCLDREPDLLSRRFRGSEIYPAELGLQGGMHVAPVDGGTLLHMAVEYHEESVAQWLLDHGADANSRAAIDSGGFGGHTPLFHTVVTLGRKDDSLARLLLRQGADPRARATFRKQLVDMGDPEKEKIREYRDVTPIGFATAFQEPQWINEAAVRAIREYGGQ
jgi:ankyrin repeat protein